MVGCDAGGATAISTHLAARQSEHASVGEARQSSSTVDGIGRPKIFGAGVSLGMLAGILIGSVMTAWLGEAAADLVHRWFDRISGRHERVNFELLLQ
jgi:hypothetical protein